MKKKYIVYQDGTYFSTTSLGDITCTKNPLQALMFDTYEEALALRNKRSERAVVPTHIYSIVFEINTEQKLNKNLIELDDSIKRINELKLKLGSEYNERL